MHYKLAIEALVPYHTSSLIWVVPGTGCACPITGQHIPPTGQLTTGNPDHPIIPVDNGMVCADDLYDVVDKLSKQLQPQAA